MENAETMNQATSQPSPMPNQKMGKDKVKGTAKDVFFYLLMIVALYISATSFGTLIFQYINHQYPEALYFDSGYSAGLIIGATSALIIAWPVFMVMSWLIGRDLKKHPEKQNLGVKRWLNYVTLFIASIVIIITLIMLVNNFLSGELSLRVGFKILATLVISGVVLGYYIWDLRRKAGKMLRLPMIVGWSATAVIIAVMVIAFLAVGSPMQQRALRFDAMRVTNLQELQYDVYGYYGQKGMLPATLDDLVDGIIVPSIPSDPETKQAYEYRVTGNTTFELCAVFATDSADPTNQSTTRYYEVTIAGGDSFEHSIGRVCFERTIDPDLVNVQGIPIDKFPQ